jgi:flavin-dependent dehydrogenase
LQVALIEREPFPRDRPGEALHPDVDPLFAQLGLGDAISEAGFIRYPGWLLERQGSQDFVPFSAGPASVRFGYQAWRADLDALLLEAVRRAGARILQPCAAEAVAASDGRVTGVRATSMDLRCRQLIDASGNFQWLARKLRLEVKSVSPRLVARYGYFAGDCGVGVLPIFREDVDGWTWIAKVKNECCQWVRLSFSGSERDSVLPPPFDRLPRAAPVRGANVAWRCVWDCAGPGYFLCGDAAAILDPAASRGVIRALTSGL